jgi:hypothetical protein
MNKSVDGYSTPVIYDNTPATVGMLEVKGVISAYFTNSAN